MKYEWFAHCITHTKKIKTILHTLYITYVNAMTGKHKQPVPGNTHKRRASNSQQPFCAIDNKHEESVPLKRFFRVILLDTAIQQREPIYIMVLSLHRAIHQIYL